MKKTLLFAIAICITSLTFAGNAELFSIDDQAINNEFSDLTTLENFVIKSNFITLNEIKTGNLFDLSGFNMNFLGSTTSGSEDFTFQWEGFLWGFLCCPVGFFVIAVNKQKDHDQKVSYWIGVAVSTILGAIYDLAFYPNYYSY